MQPRVIDCRSEHALKLGAMQAAEWCAEPLLVGSANPNGVRGNPLAGAAIQVDELVGSVELRDELVEDPKPAELSGSVCREGHRRTDLGEFVSLLEHLRRDTVAPESHRQGEAADPSADDRNPGMGAERFRHQLHLPLSAKLGAWLLLAHRALLPARLAHGDRQIT